MYKILTNFFVLLIFKIIKIMKELKLIGDNSRKRSG